MTIETIIYFLVLIDAIAANVASWSGLGETAFKNLGVFTKYFPITRGWTTYYLVLVLWVGSALVRLDVVVF